MADRNGDPPLTSKTRCTMVRLLWYLDHVHENPNGTGWMKDAHDIVEHRGERNNHTGQLSEAWGRETVTKLCQQVIDRSSK